MSVCVCVGGVTCSDPDHSIGMFLLFINTLCQCCDCCPGIRISINFFTCCSSSFVFLFLTFFLILYWRTETRNITKEACVVWLSFSVRRVSYIFRVGSGRGWGMEEAKANNVVEKVYFSSSDKMHSIFFPPWQRFANLKANVFKVSHLKRRLFQIFHNT